MAEPIQKLLKCSASMRHRLKHCVLNSGFLLLFALLTSAVQAQIVANFVGQAPTCPQGSDGGLCCTSITGGIPPYTCTITFPVGTYVYNIQTNCFTGLPSGPYTVFINDNFGNTGTANTIVAPSATPPIVITMNITDATCGQTNGSACATVTGGSGSYTYLWIRFSDFVTMGTGLCLNNMDPNESYAFTVYDTNTPCFAVVEVVVEEQNLSLTATTANSDCVAPNCNGAIDLIPNGTAPYTYTWSNGATTEDLSGLCSGTYTVNVTDANGCTGTGTYTITLNGADVLVGGTGISSNIINGVVNWTPAVFGGQNQIVVDADVIVMPGAVLNITGLDVRFTPHHSMKALTDLPNNTFGVINGSASIFDVVCGSTWRGFEISGGGINNTAARAQLNLNGCWVYHAEYAIRNYLATLPSSNPSANTTGGRITCTATLFEDNVYDMLIIDYFAMNPDGLNYGCQMNHCIFNLMLLPTPRELGGTDGSIVGNSGSGRIKFFNCAQNYFIDCVIDNQNANYANIGQTGAIYSSGSKLEFTGANVGPINWPVGAYQSGIKGFRRGIYMVGPGPQANVLAPDLNLQDTRLEGHQGIIIKGNLNIVVANNRFDPFPTLAYQHTRIGNITNGQHTAIWLDNLGNSTGANHVQQFLIAHNRIQNSLNLVGTVPVSRGILVYSTGTLDNYIIENEIHDCLNYGIDFHFRNALANGNVGVHYECNDFFNNNTDVEILGANIVNHGVATPQGFTFLNLANPPAIRSAGNDFVLSPGTVLNTKDDIKAGTLSSLPPHTYWYNANEIVNNVSEMTSNAHTPVPQLPNFCNYNWQSFLPFAPGGDDNMSIDQMRANKAGLEAELAALLDGGATLATLSEVEMANYTEAYQLYQELMQKSPALSEEVMIAAIVKEYELPKSLLALILAANPQAAKNTAVLQSLDERSDPLTTYQMEQVQSGKYWTSVVEEKQMHIDLIDAQIEQALFKMRLNGSSVAAYQNKLTTDHANEVSLKAEVMADAGNVEAAKAELITGAAMDPAAANTWGSIMTIKHIVQTLGLPMNTADVQILDNIWQTDQDGMGLLAYHILETYCGYPELEMIEAGELRSMEAESHNAIEQESKLELWPVPSDQFVNLRLPEPQAVACQIRVVNYMGQVVLTASLEAMQQEMVLPLTDLTIGFYTIVVEENNTKQLIASQSFNKN